MEIIGSGGGEAKATHRHQGIFNSLGCRKAASMSGWGFMVLTLAFFFAPIQGQAAQKPPQQNAFDDRTASRLLSQLSEALQGHSQKQFLALFDFARMKDGTLFRQQIESFFLRQSRSVPTSIWQRRPLKAIRPPLQWMLRWKRSPVTDRQRYGGMSA